MEVVNSRAAVRQILERMRHDREGSTVGFVPTMGALHEGHLSLVRRAKEDNAIVAVSIFVNPTQFNDPEDLRRYPRTLEADLDLLRPEGVDLLFVPGEKEIYPEPDRREFDFGDIDKVMEGSTRPGHFNGVAQVVSRLFEIIGPDRAYFGEKDFQQIAVVKQMVRQLDMDVQIESCPIVRESDGLALSSRNALLEPQYRSAAPKIYRALKTCADALAEESGTKGMSPRQAESFVNDLLDSEPLLKVIYFNAVNAATLQPADNWNEPEGVQGCIAV